MMTRIDTMVIIIADVTRRLYSYALNQSTICGGWKLLLSDPAPRGEENESSSTPPWWLLNLTHLQRTLRFLAAIDVPSVFTRPKSKEKNDTE